MDLDNLKKVWNENQIELPSVSDDKILSILKGKGKTALYKLYIWELIGAILFQYSKFSQYFLMSFCILGFLWQLYKILILKKVDLKNNSIIMSYKYICRYKLCINIEVFVSLLFISVFMISFFYPLSGSIPDEKRYLIYIIVSVWFVIMLALMWLVYKKFYRKQIRKIEESIMEIQDFEKDN